MNKINSRHSDELGTSPKTSAFSCISKSKFAPVMSVLRLSRIFIVLLAAALLSAACSNSPDTSDESSLNNITIKYLGYEQATDGLKFEIVVPEELGLTSVCTSFAQVTSTDCWYNFPGTLDSGTKQIVVKLADINMTFEEVAEKTLHIWFKSSNDNESGMLSVKIPSDLDGDGFPDNLSALILNDKEAPVAVLFSLTSGSPSYSPEFEFEIEATDNLGVYGYCVLETTDTPELADECWTSVKSSKTYRDSITYTVQKNGVNDLGIWFRDEHGNISETLSTSVTYTDNGHPTVISFTTVTNTENKSSIPFKLQASDSVGVTGYCISAHSLIPVATDGCYTAIPSQTQVDMEGVLRLTPGTNSYYIFVRDHAGNVSLAKDIFVSSTYTPSDTVVPTVTSFDTIDQLGVANEDGIVQFTLVANDDEGLGGFCASIDASPIPAPWHHCFVDAVPSSNNTYIFTTQVPYYGTVIFYAFVKDLAGNVSLYSNGENYKMKNVKWQDPEPPVLSEFSIVSGASVTSNQTEKFSLKSTDNYVVEEYCVTVNGSAVFIDPNLNVLDECIYVRESDALDITLDVPLVEGKNIVNAWVLDVSSSPSDKVTVTVTYTPSN